MNKLFKRIIGATLGFAMTIGVGTAVANNRNDVREANAAGTDVIDNSATSSNLGKTGTTSWATNFTITGTSGAQYYIHSMGTKGTTNALQWNANGFLNCTTSGGKLKTITITTTANKNIYLYAKTTAYSTDAPSGTSLATIAATSSGATYTFTSNYTYFALKGAASSTSVTSINIVWEAPHIDVTNIGISGTGISDNALSVLSSDTSAHTVNVSLTPTNATDQKVNIAHQSGTTGLFTPNNSQITCSSGSGSFTLTGTGATSGSETFRISANTETSKYVDLVVTALDDSVTYYTVSFDSDGGSLSPNSIQVAEGETFTFPSAGTKTHYSLDGWTSDTENFYDPGDTSPAVTADIEYLAFWTEDAKYTVTYSAGTHGTGSYAHVNQYGGTYTLLAFANLSGVSAADGYRFKNYTVGGINKNPGETFTLSAATTVTVNFEIQPASDVITIGTTGVTTTTYAEGNFSGVSSTNTGHSNAVYAGQVIKSSNGYIQFRATNPGGIVSTSSGGKVRGVTITWDTNAMASNARSLDIYCNTSAYSTGADLYNASTDGDKVGSISYTNASSYNTHIDVTGDYTYIGLRPSSSTIYIQEIDIEWELPPVLDSVTTSGQTTSFTAGNKWSYGGTLTAHYTKDKADATVTPASFKYGNSGIDPTSQGASISTSTTLDSSYSGKYVYVIYTEDTITKWTSYQITVNPASATSVTLSASSGSVALEEVFNVSSITATVNPSAYATQGVTWEVYDSDGLVEDDTYVFDGSEFYATEAADVVFHVKATATPSVYAEFTLSIYDTPSVTLLDSDSEDVTDGSASVFGDVGTLVYEAKAENFSGTITYTWSTDDDSVVSIDEDLGDTCAFYVEGISGDARLSCRVQGSVKGDITVYIDITVTAVAVTQVTWTAPTINVYSGATLSDTSGWNVKYRTNSDPSTDKTPDSFKVMLGGSEITLPYTWQVSDNGKTLGVQYSGVNSSTTTVSVTQTLQAVMASETSAWDYTFSGKVWSADGEQTIDSKAWTMSGTGGSYFGYDSDKGQQFGSGAKPYTALALSSSAFSGTIESVTVYTSGAKDIDATVQVSVGGTAYGDAQSLTASNTGYTFDLGGKKGTISIAYSNSSSKAIYIKEIVVNTISDPTNLANVAGHEAAQAAVVKFAKAFNTALGATEGCTKGLSDAWSTATSAWTTFTTEIATLGTDEEAYAKNLIKYASAQWTDNTDSDYSYCLERAMATYEKCVKSHGMTAFMSAVRTVGSNSRINPILNITNNNNIAAVIVILSMMSIAAVGGYFFLRKRKED